MVSTRTTPVWRNRASTACSELARAAVWEDAARVPALERPLFTATIGFSRPDPAGDAAELPGVPEGLEVEQDDPWWRRPAPTR